MKHINAIMLILTKSRADYNRPEPCKANANMDLTIWDSSTS